jgi:hypothetical protein
VIVDVIHVKGVTSLEAKDDAPVRPDGNGPEAFKIARQAVQSKARQVHIFRPSCSVENGKDIFHFLSVIAAEPFGFSVLK